MQTVSSYGVELRKQNIPVRQTLEIYRSAVSYLTEIYEQVWEKLAEIPDAKRRFNAAEHLSEDAVLPEASRNPACIGKCIFLRNTDGTVGKVRRKSRETQTGV